MRFMRRPIEEPESVQLVAMIDVVFVILIFFITTSVFGAIESEVDITLPTADTAVQIEQTRGEIFINIDKGGRIILNNKAMTIAELQEVLDRVAEYFPGGAVIIRGDKEAMLGQAVAVLNCCRKADIQNVSFAAVTDEPESRP
jgi:biopolymer transport protein ExbD